MKTSERKENISGKYMHYKGNDYDVFCEAFDINGNSYVLYQQCYGDKSFWLRPYDMFFETIQHDGKEVKRFMPKFTQASPTIKKIKYLINLIEKQNLSIRHTETEKNYIITNIDESLSFVNVHKSDDEILSGYFTEYEISKRLGYNSCRINKEIRFFKCKDELSDHLALKIGNNDIKELVLYPDSRDSLHARASLLYSPKREWRRQKCHDIL